MTQAFLVPYNTTQSSRMSETNNRRQHFLILIKLFPAVVNKLTNASEKSAVTAQLFFFPKKLIVYMRAE